MKNAPSVRMPGALLEPGANIAANIEEPSEHRVCLLVLNLMYENKYVF